MGIEPIYNSSADATIKQERLAYTQVLTTNIPELG
jgi:hypothetical protein